jgi:hypothetical protein
VIGSFNFGVDSLGSARLSGPIKSGPSVGKTAIVATPETSAGSSSEVNLPVSIKSTKGSTFEELDEIMENLDLEKNLCSSTIVSDEKFGNISEKDFITGCSGVSGNSEDTWRVEVMIKIT